MTHEEALNKILADSCSNPSSLNDEWQEYTIELHCASWTIHAKPLGNLQYEIKEVQKTY